ncbi:hypothetical protein Tco_0021822 [Tanacetum coccineum]
MIVMMKKTMMMMKALQLDKTRVGQQREEDPNLPLLGQLSLLRKMITKVQRNHGSLMHLLPNNIQITDTNSFIVSKKRSSDSSKKLKGIQTLTPVEQEAADIMKALKESKKMSKRQPGTGGSNEGTVTAPAHISSGPGPQLLTPKTISSGLVPQPPSPTPNVQPTKNDWDLLFCPMLDEYFNFSPSVAVVQEPIVSTGTPSSTRIDQDTPSTEPSYEESSSRIIIPTYMHSVNQPQEHIEK